VATKDDAYTTGATIVRELQDIMTKAYEIIMNHSIIKRHTLKTPWEKIKIIETQEAYIVSLCLWDITTLNRLEYTINGIHNEDYKNGYPETMEKSFHIYATKITGEMAHDIYQLAVHVNNDVIPLRCVVLAEDMEECTKQLWMLVYEYTSKKKEQK